MKTLIFILMTIVVNKTLTVKSSAFANNDFIPSKYTCDGSNINPELTIKDIPSETRSLALILDDPDAPKGTFDHWIMWNIPVKEKIEENTSPGAQGKMEKAKTGTPALVLLQALIIIIFGFTPSIPNSIYRSVLISKFC